MSSSSATPKPKPCWTKRRRSARTSSTRKIVERAKGIIMKHGRLSEGDAFHRLQKLSWDRNQKLIEVANMIVMAELALHEPDRPPASPANTRRAKIRPSRAG